MKAAYIFLVAIHGLIHLLGFVKAFNLVEVSQLTTPISRPVGLLWIVVTMLLLVYAVLRLLESEYGWIVGAAAVILSQVLILMYWSDAKFGTIPNVIILVAVLVSIGQVSFDRMVAAEEKRITTVIGTDKIVIGEEDTQSLPSPVRKWLQESGSIGAEFSAVGSIQQVAEMKLRPEQEGWYRATATQHTRVDRPEFLWSVDLAMNSMLRFVGRDKFVGGKGSMLIKANALVPIVNATGPKLDEGTLQRYLGEMVWFPVVAVSKYVTWEPLDNLSARATMDYMGTSGSGVFYFDDSGNFIRFSAMRYQGNEPESKRYEWVLEVDAYANYDGIRIPSNMRATWRLPDGDWTWLKLDIVAYKVR